MQSKNNDNPIANGLFWFGIIFGSGMLALRLAGIFWSLFLQVWYAFALLGATILNIGCLGAALNGLRYAPMRTDVDLDDVFNPKYDEEDLYAIEPEEWPPNPAKALRKKIEEQQEIPAPPQQNTFELHINHEEKQKHFLDVPVHSAEKLNWPDTSFLLRNDYEEREFVPLGKVRRKKFLIKRQPRKSLEHTFLLYNLWEKLSERKLNVEVTQAQGISVRYTGEDYALCVVTPDDLRKHNYLAKKASFLTGICGSNWWFVVTQSAYAKSFRRYGAVLTRNDMEGWMRTTFSPNSPSP